jgi:hypothetical protein
MGKRTDSSIAKIERAKEHIQNLNAEIREFVARNIYVVRIDREPKTGNSSA